MPGTQCPPGAGAGCGPRLPSPTGGWGPGRACAAQSLIRAAVQILARPLLPFEPSEPLCFQLEWKSEWHLVSKVLWKDERRLSSVLGT